MYDIYHEIDTLMVDLKEEGMGSFSDVLYHRVYKVSWTPSSELFEELDTQIIKFVEECDGEISESISNRLFEIQGYIKKYL